ncbi:SLC13 family permease [Bacillus thuringiensis]|uniref:SLC13 family permease n=1 Tax=Bacillus thuringiensis TaxID=1428 RepID=UPI00211D6ACB|nr:SLC13 family permease [Bacillus thuringiensis]
MEIFIVLLLVSIMIVLMILEVERPDILSSLTLAVLIFCGIISPSEALKGFANEGMLTIGLLFIVAGALQKTQILNYVTNNILGDNRNLKKALLRLMVPVTTLSAFMNNTPIVVMFIGEVSKWCKKKGISPSKLLLPLSYASIFGGMITLIGTSTNIIVNGLMRDNNLNGFSFFELSLIGIPAAILGILYVIFFGVKILPSNKTMIETLNEGSRNYLCKVIVKKGADIIGRSVEEANLRNLKGLYLIEIIRNNKRITPVSTSTVIKEDDQLVFTGLVSTIAELKKNPGISLEGDSHLDLDYLKNGNAYLIETIVSHDSSLLQKSIKESNFRSKFNAVVVAVNRRNIRVHEKIGDIIPKPGDALLLLAGKDFNSKDTNDFHIISSLLAGSKTNSKKSIITIISTLLMIFLATFNLLTMFESVLIAVCILIIFQCITPQEAKNSIHFNVLLLISSSFGIGIALEKSGAAQWVASQLVSCLQYYNSVVLVVLLVYFLSNLFTEFLSNSATAVMMYPIVISIAEQVGVNPMALIITMTIAASAGFATPIGYQTNLIVYGPGGYKFKDYLKVGLPLNLLYCIVTLIVIMLFYI